MIDFSHSTEASINASPQAIFDIVSDLTRHAELAGSGELNRVDQRPAGSVEVGTHLHAEETVVMADGSTMDITAESVVVTYDPPILLDRKPPVWGAGPPNAMVVFHVSRG